MLAKFTFLDWLRILSLALGAGAIFRLWWTGLSQTYRALFAYLAFHSAQACALFAIRFTHRPGTFYAWTWACTEPLLWLFYVLLVLELYTRALQNYKGLQTAGRWALYAALSLAVLISGATLIPRWRSPSERVPIVFYYLLIERGILFSLVIFILLILLFLSWYPVKLSRNIAIHCVVCTLYFLSGTLGFLVRNLEGDTVMRAVNTVLLAVSVLCWAAWLLLLNPRGETVSTTFRHDFSDEEQKRLVKQLTAINSSLLRATRK